MKRIFFLLLFLAGGHLLHGQTQPTFDKMVDFLPPPPNAAAIIRYGEVSINKNTGSPNVSIPLFRLPGKKLSAPVSIGYSSGCVKVDEIASRVGMGWSINAGGVVTRTVRGVPDETNTRHTPYATVGFNFATYNYMKRIAESPDHGLSGGYDSEPDLFHFNFNGYSGSFVFTDQMHIRQVHRSAIKIECDLSLTATAYHFKFTTPDGVIYLFGGTGAVEKTKREQTCGKTFDQYIATSWYLKEIQHPNGEKITFSYTAHEYRYDNGVSQTMFKNLVIDVGCDACSVPISATTCINVVRTQGVLLSGITSPGYGQINFYYTTRQDCEDKLISRIVLTDSVNEVSSYDFTYLTITSNASYNNEYYAGNNKTPYLSQLVENSSDGLLHKTHYFSYIDPGGRPSRLSFSQDHWGFFNGRVNTSFTPALGNAYISLFPQAVANREPRFEYASKGLLEKIVYPTGGISMLLYEPHAVADTLQFNTRHEFQCEVTGTGAMTEVIRTSTFVTAQNQWIELNLTCIDNSGNGSFDPLHNIGRVEILPSVGASVFDEVLSPGTTVTRYVSIPAGTYTLRYKANGTVVTMRPTVKYIRQSTGFSSVDVTGGARIKAVLTGNPGESPAVKEYYYTQLSDLGGSSLFLSWGPRYLGTTIKELPCQSIPGISYMCPFQTLNSSSLKSLFDFAASHVSYSAIVEGNGENFEGGGIETTFLVGSDALGEVLWNKDIISSPLSNFSASYHGKTKAESVFKKHGDGSLRVIKKTEYTYKSDTRGDSTVYGYAIVMKVPQVSFDTTCNLADISCSEPLARGLSCFDMVRYRIFSNWVYADTLKETLYDENGLNPQTNISLFNYNNAQHLQLTQTTTSNSRGEAVEINNKYPHDYAGQQVYDDMILKNDIVRLVNISQVENSLPVFEAMTNYGAVGNNNHEPVSLQKSMKGAGLEMEGTIDAYDEKGNILQYTGKDGVVNAIIWGYNRKYPVAKVAGVTYASAIAELSVSVAQLQSLDGAALRTEINRIRTNIPAAQVITYTYKHMAGVTSITDVNNRTQTYEYDAFNRLMHVRDKDSNVVKKMEYSYANVDPLDTLKVYFNQAVSLAAVPSCISGYQGSQTAYTIPAGKYFSLVSQTDANAKAAADPGGLYYANKFSYCSNTICSGQGYAMINCYCELGRIEPVSCYDNPDGTWVQNYKYKWSDNSLSATTYSQTLPACTGQDKKKVNCACLIGLKLYRYSYENQDGTWTCVYYYHWRDGSNSQDYTEISPGPCDDIEEL